MLIIGERINASRPAIKKAVGEKNKDFILSEAEKQIKAGASIIDVNCGTSLDKELDDMLWMIDAIQEGTDMRLSIDSVDSEVVHRALDAHKGQAIVNSITAEKSRYEKILPICKKYKAQVIALTMDEKGMPNTAEDRFEIATIITEICEQYGLPKEDIYFDPLARPVSSEPGQAREFLGAIRLMKEIGLKTIGGLSNISFGLPNRRLLNKTFFSMACAFGLDACIIDPLDTGMMSAIHTSETLLGRDEYCMNYLKAYRSGSLNG